MILKKRSSNNYFIKPFIFILLIFNAQLKSRSNTHSKNKAKHLDYKDLIIRY